MFYLKKQRFGDTMQSPEGLEDSPFNQWNCINLIHTSRHLMKVTKIS